jgi:hypothetical protein
LIVPRQVGAAHRHGTRLGIGASTVTAELSALDRPAIAFVATGERKSF